MNFTQDELIEIKFLVKQALNDNTLPEEEKKEMQNILKKTVFQIKSIRAFEKDFKN